MAPILDCNQYGYDPSHAAAIVFLVLFALETLIVLAYSIRQPWLIAVVVGGVGELAGWGGRYWAANSPCDNNAFLMQICSLIIAPCFFSAGLYIIMGRMIRHARELSLLPPKGFLWIFCVADFISLVLQGAGGGLASTAKTRPARDIGTHVMEAGIIFQLVAMSAFVTLGLIFGYSAWGKIKIPKSLLLSMGLATIMIFIRNFYRAVELSQGWSGYLITHEVYAIALDGGPMSICLGSFAIMCIFGLLRKGSQLEQSQPH